MHRHPILAATAIAVGTIATYYALIIFFTAAHALGWYAGATA
ncbi:hypothetical protein [Gordonia hirsuta]|nr:hypothetical protein [Gordonia hirsuta]